MHTRTVEGMERIVITGMGAVTPVGLSVCESSEAINNGETGIVSIADTVLAGYSQFDTSVAAPILDFNMRDNPRLFELMGGQKKLGQMHRAAQLALAACDEALGQAGLQDQDGRLLSTRYVNPERVGVVFGTGVGGADEVAEARSLITREKPSKPRPSNMLRLFPDRVASVPSMVFGAKGPVETVVAACATGNAAIVGGARLLRLGEADIVIVGGAEGSLSAEAVSFFDGSTALDTEKDPKKAGRPFHEDENGFVMGEAGASLVLETLHSAQRRGATILAELVGYGQASDADHPTNPNPEGQARALRLALGKYVDYEGIYINGHGTGTGGDKIELQAIGRVLDPRQVVGISSTKGATGHTFGAAGAFEAIESILALRGCLPPTAKLDRMVEEAERWPMIVGRAAQRASRLAVNSSFGFGGLNVVTVYALPTR